MHKCVEEVIKAIKCSLVPKQKIILNVYVADKKMKKAELQLKFSLF